MAESNFSVGDMFSGGASSLLSGATGLIGTALQYKYNKRLMKLQNKLNVDMWKMQAEYNSPQAQMQRYQEAGLNPFLIYGQGSNGNMSQAPEQVVPNVPDYTKGMAELSKAFNIENLRTLVANRKKAEAEAKESEINAKTTSDIYQGMTALGNHVEYNPKTGQFGFNVPYKLYVNNGELPGIGFYHAMRVLADNYRGTSLLQPRADLLNAQYRYLQPQILMSNFDLKHQPTTYWIGQGTRVLNSLGNIIPQFSPLKWSHRPAPTYNTTRIYY